MHNYDRPDLAAQWSEEFSAKEEGPRGGIVKIDIGHLIERVVASARIPRVGDPQPAVDRLLRRSRRESGNVGPAQATREVARSFLASGTAQPKIHPDLLRA
jgi:hypothetical protein